jgi:hypothetical protein
LHNLCVRIERAARMAFPAMALAAVALVVPPAVAATIDVAGVKTATGPAVCRVTAENSWGVPLAMASGFLLGDGRFAVTDLGVVARPGVDRVSLHFQDGVTVAVREFGMADPGLGLVLLRLPADAPKRQGLALAQGLPSLDGSAPVVVAGWQWGRQFEVVVGRLCKGPLIKEVAALTRVDTPFGVESFLRVDGGRLDGASGSPVLDADGTVLAVNLDVPIRTAIATLAMPATSLRTALMTAAPQLKPLSELPKPLWPARSLRTQGGPVTPQAFLGLISQFKTALTCQKCGGKGRVTAPYGGVGGGGYGYGYGYGDYTVICPTCGGETVVFNEAALKLLGTVAEQGTSTVWAPVVDERVRAKVRAGAQDTLVTLAGYGYRFQRELARVVGLALEKSSLTFPAGIAFKARVLKAQDAPDGRYVFLAQDSSVTFVVRVEDLVPPGGKGVSARTAPPEGSWVFVAGTILGRCKADGRQGLFVLPMEWMPASAPDVGRPDRPARP